MCFGPMLLPITFRSSFYSVFSRDWKTIACVFIGNFICGDCFIVLAYYAFCWGVDGISVDADGISVDVVGIKLDLLLLWFMDIMLTNIHNPQIFSI